MVEGGSAGIAGDGYQARLAAADGQQEGRCDREVGYHRADQRTSAVESLGAETQRRGIGGGQRQGDFDAIDAGVNHAGEAGVVEGVVDIVREGAERAVGRRAGRGDEDLGGVAGADGQ